MFEDVGLRRRRGWRDAQNVRVLRLAQAALSFQSGIFIFIRNSFYMASMQVHEQIYCMRPYLKWAEHQSCLLKKCIEINVNMSCYINELKVTYACKGGFKILYKGHIFCQKI